MSSTHSNARSTCWRRCASTADAGSSDTGSRRRGRSTAARAARITRGSTKSWITAGAQSSRPHNHNTQSQHQFSSQRKDGSHMDNPGMKRQSDTRTGTAGQLHIKGNWNVVKGKLKKQFGSLTDNDLNYMEGKEEELIGRLQRALGK